MAADPPLSASRLTEAISAAMVALYARVYERERIAATTYINDNVVVCILEDTLARDETERVAKDSAPGLMDGRVAFETRIEDEFTSAVERLTQRRVVAFMSADQSSPGIASELFFLEADEADPRARVSRERD